MSLANEICEAWRNRLPLEEILSRFVIETESRAAGCWRWEDDHLKLVGFGWAADMSNEVSQGFQDATRLVSLNQQGFGIVKAVEANAPTIALRDPSTTGLPRSASWIAKFDANSSLAVPIRADGAIVGAVAVSTAAVIEERDPLWIKITNLAEELGRATA